MVQPFSQTIQPSTTQQQTTTNWQAIEATQQKTIGPY